MPDRTLKNTREYMHFHGPPGFKPCTRPWPHEGPCKHEALLELPENASTPKPRATPPPPPAKKSEKTTPAPLPSKPLPSILSPRTTTVQRYGTMSEKAITPEQERELATKRAAHGGPSRYSNVFEPNALNKPFWQEVLVGRRIVKIEWGDAGIAALILDNNEKVLVTMPNALGIKLV